MRKQFQELLQIAAYLAGKDALLENKIQTISQRFMQLEPSRAPEKKNSPRNEMGSNVLKL